MTQERISVRQLEINDHERIVDYFLNSDTDFLMGMGVDIPKLPSRQEWLDILHSNFNSNLDQKKFYYIIWLLNDQPIGHSNINKIVFAEEAYMHLHMWQDQTRRKGIGAELLKLSIPFFFNAFRLKNLFCEPMASNVGPNKTLPKLGFEFIKEYETIPGWINSLQRVNRWCLTKEKFNWLYPN